ncbi:methyl-accepting chemotaxis protein [Candidatus Magnetaquicoccus inordinatus]|uniref:methyl-accepting chemotaxis protein n=1 Tax=Candidatus Magnetaquicoccus inordinatus TaxID=2496818 RepID=UPI00102B74BE|nr:methyl-accepting chemotaxis protein [Candidatus Magnetaquicoccus inordinatus]
MDKLDPVKLSQEIRAELRRELASLRADGMQIRTQVQEAVGKLSESFGMLRELTAEQNELVSGLVSSLGKQSSKEKKGNITIGEFVTATDAILQAFVEHIVAVSQQSMAMMYRIDDVSAEMLQVEESLGKINAIADLTKVLGLNARIVAAREGQASGAFSVVAAEVRRLAIASREVSGLISDVVVETSNHVDTAKEVVKEMASKDMSFSMESKNKVDAMMAQISENDRLTAKLLQQVVQITGEIHNSIGMAVLSLQFEDMVTQLTQGIEKKVTAMEKWDNVFDLELQFNDAIPRRERVLHAQQRLQEQKQLMQSTSHRPVQQANMDEGDIELF